MTVLEINDVTFNIAEKEAGYWARKRCLKKMRKVVHRPRYWQGEFKQVPSPMRVDAEGKPVMLKVLDTSKPHGVFSGTRPPKDAETYVERFVSFYYHRAIAKESKANGND